MKRIHILSMFASLLAMFVVLPSCKDDDKNNDSGNTDQPASVVTIDNDILTGGLSTDLNSAVLELPINCDGEWLIAMAKGTNWAQILDWKMLYNGKQTISIAVDENSTGAGRSTTLKVSDADGNIQTISLHQEGNSDSNGSGENFAGKGLGCGIDYDYALDTKGVAARQKALPEKEKQKFSLTRFVKTENIYNITTIQRLQKASKYPLNNSAYVESSINFADMNAKLFDSSVVQNKTLDVTLKLDLQFGPIEFAAEGAYHSTKDESRAKIDYVIERAVPMFNVYLAPGELSTYAAMHGMDSDENLDSKLEDIDNQIAHFKKVNGKRKLKNLNEDGLTEEQAAIIDDMYDAISYLNDYAGIYSANFTKQLNNLYSALAVRGGKKNLDKANDILSAIDSYYGPFFVTGGEFGGSVSLHCKIDTMYLKGDAHLGGSLAGGMGGLFNVSGKFTYDEDGANTLRNSKIKAYVYGGKANDVENEIMAVATGGDATNLRKWQGILENWIATMWGPSGDNPKQSEASPISYNIAPIWVTIEDPTVQKYAKDYFMAAYKDRGIERYFGIMTGEETATPDDLINQKTDSTSKPQTDTTTPKADSTATSK